MVHGSLPRFDLLGMPSQFPLTLAVPSPAVPVQCAQPDPNRDTQPGEEALEVQAQSQEEPEVAQVGDPKPLMPPPPPPRPPVTRSATVAASPPTRRGAAHPSHSTTVDPVHSFPPGMNSPVPPGQTGTVMGNHQPPGLGGEVEQGARAKAPGPSLVRRTVPRPAGGTAVGERRKGERPGPLLKRRMHLLSQGMRPWPGQSLGRSTI